MGKYHIRSIVDELVLNNNLNLTITKCLPVRFNISYSNKIAKYHALNPENLRPSQTFYFNAEFMMGVVGVSPHH